MSRRYLADLRTTRIYDRRRRKVTRTMYMEVPPRVEYDLSTTGRELLERVLPLWNWIAEKVALFKATRERVDRHGRAFLCALLEKTFRGTVTGPHSWPSESGVTATPT